MTTGVDESKDDAKPPLEPGNDEDSEDEGEGEDGEDDADKTELGSKRFPKRKVVLVVSYCGTGYCGLQMYGKWG